jgi:dimethylglycine catabolism B
MSGHHLPLLEGRTDELSKCAFCPKLCRATCVVSESEPREALTPWGKMTNAFEAARGGEDLPGRAELAWGCSNCLRCREACDHRNPVTATLNDARADFVAAGMAPPSVRALLDRAPAIHEAGRAAVAKLADEPGVQSGAGHALLLGCRYARELRDEARAAIRLAAGLVGAVELLSGCCGAWQRAAGALAEARASREALLGQMRPGQRLLVLDPGCALELREASPTPLVALAARHAERFVPRQVGPVRYHDSCALGRGLGLYDEPRQLLARVTGASPLELETPRAWSRCSGGGGILPVSMKTVARAAAQRLRREHEELGGGTLVTGCASSLSQLRRAGARAVDLIALLERGLERDD